MIGRSHTDATGSQSSLRGVAVIFEERDCYERRSLGRRSTGDKYAAGAMGGFFAIPAKFPRRFAGGVELSWSGPAGFFLFGDSNFCWLYSAPLELVHRFAQPLANGVPVCPRFHENKHGNLE